MKTKLLIMLMALACQGMLSGQEAVSEFEKVEALKSLQKKIRLLRKEDMERKKNQEQRFEELIAQKRAATRELLQVTKQVEQVKKDFAKAEEEQAHINKNLEQIDKENKKACEIILTFLNGISEELANGINWKLDERTQSLKDAQQAARTKEALAANALASLGKLQNEEEAMARLVEMSVVKIKQNEGSLAVNAFHLGKLGVVFANESGNVVGFAQAGQRLEDVIQKEDSTAADGYLRAIEILKRQRTPALIRMYFPAQTTKAGE